MNGNKKKNFEREGIKKPDSIRRYWEGNGKEKEGRIREKEGDKEKRWRRYKIKGRNKA